MKTYYKVITRITDRRSSIVFGGEVKCEERPENTCTETAIADIYEDFFESRGEADLFIRTQRQGL